MSTHINSIGARPMLPIYVLSRQLQENVYQRIEQKMKNSKVTKGDIDISRFAIIVNFGSYATAQEGADSELTMNWFESSDAEKSMCVEAFAAIELRRYLCKICGLDKENPKVLPIISDSSNFSGNRFLIGQFSSNKQLRAYRDILNFQDEDFLPEPESFTMHTVKEDEQVSILLAGFDRNGSLYAVYDFLEKLGCRWFGLGEENEYIPKLDKISFPKNYSSHRGFPLRLMYGFQENRGTLAFFSWMAKNKFNLWGADNTLPGMRRRGIRIFGGNHSIQRTCGMGGNFDIGDEKLMNKFTKNVVKELQDGRYKDCDFIDYIGEDWGKRCDCERCRAIGTPTDRELYIVYHLRQEIKDAVKDGRLNRDVPVLFYAYYDTTNSPTKPLPDDFDYENCICGFWTERCTAHAFFDTNCDETLRYLHKLEPKVTYYCRETNADLYKHFRGWLDNRGYYKGKVGIGDYYGKARHYELPNLVITFLSLDIPHLYDLGAYYVSYMHCSPGNWGPKTIRNYLLAKLVWEPHLDVIELLADYFLKRYGKASFEMLDFYFSLERATSNLMWLKSHFISRLNFLKDKDEPLFIWEHLHQEPYHAKENDGLDMDEMLEELDNTQKPLYKAFSQSKREVIRGHLGEDRNWFEYADATLRFYEAMGKTYEYGRKHEWGAWGHRTQNQFRKAIVQARRILGVDLPVFLIGTHYNYRPMWKTTMLEKAFRMFAWRANIDVSCLFPQAKIQSRIIGPEKIKVGDTSLVVHTAQKREKK